MNSTSHISKAEIHVHLEATISPELCRKFAKRNKVTLSEDIFGNRYAYAWNDFYDFIKNFSQKCILLYKNHDWVHKTYENFTHNQVAPLINLENNKFIFININSKYRII